MVADIEELENVDASEIHARRLIAREVPMSNNGERVMFLSLMEEIRLSENPPQYWIIPHEVTSIMMIFKENRTGLSKKTK